MGTDELFKKRKTDRQQRSYGFKNPKANSFLIVTEGERTEPLYFNGIQELIKTKIGGTVNVIELPTVDIYGEGCSTRKLLEKTDEIVSKAKIEYQNIWVLFDKDDFEDFDQAIMEAHARGYEAAWSNQSFEYWIYLHFCYSDSALHRDDWNSKLDEIFKLNKLGNEKYQKNYKNIYELVNKNDGVNRAIKHAKRRMASFKLGKIKPSEYDPGTMVYVLFEKLISYLNE